MVVASCGWVIPSRRFEETYPIHYQGYESMNLLIILMMKTVYLSETSGKNDPTSRHNSPEGQLRERMTQPRGTTAQKACFLSNKAVGA